MGTELKALLNSLIDQILELFSLKCNEMMVECGNGNCSRPWLLICIAASFQRGCLKTKTPLMQFEGILQQFGKLAYYASQRVR